jgi:hypothetical protein
MEGCIPRAEITENLACAQAQCPSCTKHSIDAFIVEQIETT